MSQASCQVERTDSRDWVQPRSSTSRGLAIQRKEKLVLPRTFKWIERIIYQALSHEHQYCWRKIPITLTIGVGPWFARCLTASSSARRRPSPDSVANYRLLLKTGLIHKRLDRSVKSAPVILTDFNEPEWLQRARNRNQQFCCCRTLRKDLPEEPSTRGWRHIAISPTRRYSSR